jgi:hypothetical protein
MEKTVKLQLAAQILNDSILSERVIRAMNQLLNLSENTTESVWAPSYRFYGISTAYNLLGYNEDEEQVTDQLHEIFFRLFNSEQSKPTSERKEVLLLAKDIVSEWNHVIQIDRLIG